MDLDPPSGPGQRARRAPRRLASRGAAACAALGILAGAGDAAAAKPPIGLSLWWQEGEVRLEDGTPKTVDLYDDHPRYLQEIDITAAVETTTDEGLDPLIDDSDMSGLDWSGVTLADEDWRPAFDGTFTRSRFYRGAKWMERYSVFFVIPSNDLGFPVGSPILTIAGADDFALPPDDGFVRRFVARQITYGCPAIDDCTGASRFVAQGLVQLRDARHGAQRAEVIPKAATQLKLVWTEDLGNPRFVSVERKKTSASPYRYGFEVEIEPASTPANGSYWVPGEGIDLRLTFRDGAGNRLHPLGSLPTYGAYVRDEIESGLRYYDGLQELLTAYWALKHREGLTIVALGGPTDALHMPDHQVGFFDLFGPQADFATATEDGFSSVATLVPPIGVQATPELWDTPVSDIVHFVIPADAPPGTYVATVKARRDWGGEALNRAGTVDVQVGQAEPTGFQAATGKCNNCHSGTSSLDQILHGLSDRRTCYTCHSSLAFEPDHALDYRIHLIHSRSERFPGNVEDCSTCHLSPPSGPPRGFPGIGPY
jgi:hypothetical protein